MAAKKKRGATPPGPCRHFLEKSNCPLCNGRTAYATRGGRTFHRERTCEALATGQAKVAERGHTPDPIQVVKVNSPLIDHRLPCKVCFPDSYAARPRPVRTDEAHTESRKQKAASPPLRSPSARKPTPPRSAPKTRHVAGAMQHLSDGHAQACTCGVLSRARTPEEVETLMKRHLSKR